MVSKILRPLPSKRYNCFRVRKLQPNGDESSSDEVIEDNLAPAEGYRLVSTDSLLKFVKRIHAQTPCNLGKNYAS